MNKIVSTALAGMLACGCSVAALAAPQHVRLRGTIEAVSGSTLTVKTYSGKTADLTLSSATKIASVLPAHLSDIKSGDFIGAGATGPENNIVALEVVIFPNSMRGTGEGHYAWSIPAVVASADQHKSASLPPGAPPVQGTMTNGTVASAVTAAPPVQGTMTNATVTNTASTAGGKELTVTYDHGSKVTIHVPTDTPIVRFAAGSRSDLVVGAKTFAVASKASNGSLDAAFVAVGKNGLMPPM